MLMPWRYQNRYILFHFKKKTEVHISLMHGAKMDDYIDRKMFWLCQTIEMMRPDSVSTRSIQKYIVLFEFFSLLRSYRQVKRHLSLTTEYYWIRIFENCLFCLDTDPNPRRPET